MASENFRGGCRCRDAQCLRRCEPGHFILMWAPKPTTRPEPAAYGNISVCFRKAKTYGMSSTIHPKIMGTYAIGRVKVNSRV